MSEFSLAKLQNGSVQLGRAVSIGTICWSTRGHQDAWTGVCALAQSGTRGCAWLPSRGASKIGTHNTNILQDVLGTPHRTQKHVTIQICPSQT
jgi:hypothetical protein